MEIIELNNINKKYGEKIILENFSLKVHEGELLAIMGKSGSGKSTILNIMGLLEDFDSGELIIDGEKNVKCNSIRSNKILREKISYVFQNFALIDEKSVLDNLNISLKYVPMSSNYKLKRIKEILKVVGLEGFENRKIYELSGGEQQRIAIARVMLKPCKIVLADEPTGSLDKENRDVIINLLESLNKNGKTVVIVTHDDYVGDKCNRVVNL